jgi:hypothetical protein
MTCVRVRACVRMPTGQARRRRRSAMLDQVPQLQQEGEEELLSLVSSVRASLRGQPSACVLTAACPRSRLPTGWSWPASKTRSRRRAPAVRPRTATDARAPAGTAAVLLAQVARGLCLAVAAGAELRSGPALLQARAARCASPHDPPPRSLLGILLHYGARRGGTAAKRTRTDGRRGRLGRHRERTGGRAAVRARRGPGGPLRTILPLAVPQRWIRRHGAGCGAKRGTLPARGVHGAHTPARAGAP